MWVSWAAYLNIFTHLGVFKGAKHRHDGQQLLVIIKMLKGSLSKGPQPRQPTTSNKDSPGKVC